MSAQPVHVLAPRLRCAVDELVPDVVPVAGPAGAVCLLEGRGPWWREVERLFDRGARGAVVVEPSTTPVDEVAALGTLAGPVALCRRRLHERTALVGGAPVHLVLADVLAARERAGAAVRDAAGWSRLLAGGALTPLSLSAGPSAVVAALVSAGGTPVTLTLAVGPAGTSTALGVLGLGPRRTEVRVDDASGRSEVSVADAEGALVRPRRYEGGVRAALRRAVEALAGPGAAGAAVLPDLAELEADEVVAARVTAELRP